MGERTVNTGPEAEAPGLIHVPRKVRESLTLGLTRLAEEIDREKPEILVFFLRSARLLEKAVAKRVSGIPFIEAFIDRSFTARFKNWRMEVDPLFTEKQDLEASIVRVDRDIYLPWLKDDSVANNVARDLREKAVEVGVINPACVMAIDDVAFDGDTVDFTWPTIAGMAFGENVRFPHFLVMGHKHLDIDWLVEIISQNFGVSRNCAELDFLVHVASGYTPKVRNRIVGENQLRETESFVRLARDGYEAKNLLEYYQGKIGVEKLISLGEKISEALAEVVWDGGSGCAPA